VPGAPLVSCSKNRSTPQFLPSDRPRRQTSRPWRVSTERCEPRVCPSCTPEEDLRFVRERVFPTCTVWVGGRAGIAGYCVFRDGWVDHLYVAVARTVGNCVATAAVPVWERELNLQLAARVLDSDVVVGGGEGLTGLPRPRGQSKRAVLLPREALAKHDAAQVSGDNGGLWKICWNGVILA
jgi:hypothetical protein